MRTKTERAGLVFSVGRVSRRLKTGDFATHIEDDGAVFLSGVIQFAVDGLLELARNAARFNNKTVIRPRNILTAVKIHEGYGKVFRKTWISGAGVLPHSKAVAEVTQAKKEYYKAKARKMKNKRRREGEEDEEEEITVRKRSRARSENREAQAEEEDQQPKKKTRNAAPKTIPYTTKTNRPTKMTKAQLRVQEQREQEEAYQKVVHDTRERTARQMARHQASLEQQDEKAINGVGVKQAAKKAATAEARKKAEAEAEAKARIVGMFLKGKKNATTEQERKAEEERKAALAKEQREDVVPSQDVGQDGGEEDEPIFSSSDESYGIGLTKEEIEKRIDIVSDQVFEERQRSQERGPAEVEDDDDDEDEEGDDDEEDDKDDEAASSSREE